MSSRNTVSSSNDRTGFGAVANSLYVRVRQAGVGVLTAYRRGAVFVLAVVVGGWCFPNQMGRVHASAVAVAAQVRSVHVGCGTVHRLAKDTTAEVATNASPPVRFNAPRPADAFGNVATDKGEQFTQLGTVSRVGDIVAAVPTHPGVVLLADSAREDTVATFGNLTNNYCSHSETPNSRAMVRSVAGWQTRNASILTFCQMGVHHGRNQ